MYCYQCVYGCCDYSGYCLNTPTYSFCDNDRDQVYKNNVGQISGSIIGAVFGVVIVIAIICWCRRQQLLQNLNTNFTQGQNQGNQSTTVIMTNNQPSYAQNMYQQQQPGVYQQSGVYQQPGVYQQLGAYQQPSYNQPFIMNSYQPQPVYNAPVYYPNQGPVIIQS